MNCWMVALSLNSIQYDVDIGVLLTEVDKRIEHSQRVVVESEVETAVVKLVHHGVVAVVLGELLVISEHCICVVLVVGDGGDHSLYLVLHELAIVHQLDILFPCCLGLLWVSSRSNVVLEDFDRNFRPRNCITSTGIPGGRVTRSWSSCQNPPEPVFTLSSMNLRLF